MSKDWDLGFDDGYKFAYENWNPNTGHYTRPLPATFVHREGLYNCGFGEGLISGRSEVLRKTFGEYKSIHWAYGKPVVTK